MMYLESRCLIHDIKLPQCHKWQVKSCFPKNKTSNHLKATILALLNTLNSSYIWANNPQALWHHLFKGL